MPQRAAGRRVGCRGLLGALLVAAGAAAAAPPAGEAVVRVLLMETDDAVRIRGGSAGAGGVLVEPGPQGLRADGREVGTVWRVEGGGILSAGALRVRGSLELRRVPRGVRVVNRVALEDYVAGTVGNEVYPGWSPEMLKAQAVVTRTYALHQRARRTGRDFDLTGDTAGQVYRGIDSESPAVRRATAATRGEYLAYDQKPILAVYHSASGGLTASAEEVWGRPTPYLVSVPVPDEEDSPDTYWRASVSGTTLGRALGPLGIDVGPVRGLRIAERSSSGRVLRVEVRGAGGIRTLEARALREALGGAAIRSTLFEIRPVEGGFVFVGTGFGHGVGMSQWGAQAMAERGAGYREILATFYPGAVLVGGVGR